MFVYAGIDEAGYGPAFGPLVIGRCVLRIPKLEADAEPPDLWKRLNQAVCRNLSGRKGRIAVNDSKKLKTKAAGIAHLETGCLAFASVMGVQPADVAEWLDALGETCHRDAGLLPWYAPTDESPWQALPEAAEAGELAIARSMLARTAQRIGVEVASMGVSLVTEDRFNTMVAATRSKAATSFTFVAKHLWHIWQEHANDQPVVVVDRQSGRMRYRELLAPVFEGCEVDVIRESAPHSTYKVHAPGNGQASMTIHFQTEAETHHMPVALASMIAKYNRELFMHRFNAYFTQRLPHIAPTAGYGSDAKRYWQEIRSELAKLGIDPLMLKRQS